MRGRKEKKQREDSNVKTRHQRNVPNQETRIHSRS